VFESTGRSGREDSCSCPYKYTRFCSISNLLSDINPFYHHHPLYLPPTNKSPPISIEDQHRTQLNTIKPNLTTTTSKCPPQATKLLHLHPQPGPSQSKKCESVKQQPRSREQRKHLSRLTDMGIAPGLIVRIVREGWGTEIEEEGDSEGGNGILGWWYKCKRDGVGRSW
jgi:hypothetical protein